MASDSSRLCLAPQPGDLHSKQKRRAPEGASRGVATDVVERLRIGLRPGEEDLSEEASGIASCSGDEMRFGVNVVLVYAPSDGDVTGSITR